MIKIFKSAIFIFFVISANVHAETIKVFEFTDEEFKTLKVRKVKGKTKWTLGSNDNGNYIRAFKNFHGDVQSDTVAQGFGC